jgi:hypothetical protein
MACAAVTAVQLSLWKLRNQHAADSISPAAAAFEAIRQSLNAVGLTCVIFSIYWHLKGYAGLTQPGQCLLMGHAFSALELYWMVLLLWSLGPDFASAAHNLDLGGFVAWTFRIANGAIYFGLMAFYGWCAWRIADSLPWRLTFAMLALAVVAAPLTIVFMTRFGYSPNLAVAASALVPGCVVLLLEIWCVTDDLIYNRARFWTHWVGLVLSIPGKLLLIVGGLINLFY